MKFTRMILMLALAATLSACGSDGGAGSGGGGGQSGGGAPDAPEFVRTALARITEAPSVDCAGLRTEESVLVAPRPIGESMPDGREIAADIRIRVRAGGTYLAQYREWYRGADAQTPEYQDYAGTWSTEADELVLHGFGRGKLSMHDTHVFFGLFPSVRLGDMPFIKGVSLNAKRGKNLDSQLDIAKCSPADNPLMKVVDGRYRIGAWTADDYWSRRLAVKPTELGGRLYKSYPIGERVQDGQESRLEFAFEADGTFELDYSVRAQGKVIAHREVSGRWELREGLVVLDNGLGVIVPMPSEGVPMPVLLLGRDPVTGKEIRGRAYSLTGTDIRKLADHSVE
ncbi:MAG TPA: hypothetical protein PKC28_12485 [Bdellovibrionales bacterium]|nr:hypothetical protein [Bdellovibrionales bacterium]